ncbi:MAG: thiamine-phosphate kinase, partial [Terriglobia bacterium]
MTDEQAVTTKLRGLARIPRGSALVLGIGDDCAIYRPRGSASDLLFTTDMLIEDVHFRRETHTAAVIGRNALARGLSDIAAMGGAPRFCLVSLCVPAWAGAPWVDSFFRALTTFGNRVSAPLAGGDLSHAASLACDVVVCGDVPRGQALLRSGARAGHQIFVSGRLGGA